MLGTIDTPTFELRSTSLDDGCPPRDDARCCCEAFGNKHVARRTHPRRRESPQRTSMGC